MTQTLSKTQFHDCPDDQINGIEETANIACRVVACGLECGFGALLRSHPGRQ